MVFLPQVTRKTFLNDPYIHYTRCNYVLHRHNTVWWLAKLLTTYNFDFVLTVWYTALEIKMHVNGQLGSRSRFGPILMHYLAVRRYCKTLIRIARDLT